MVSNNSTTTQYNHQKWLLSSKKTGIFFISSRKFAWNVPNHIFLQRHTHNFRSQAKLAPGKFCDLCHNFPSIFHYEIPWYAVEIHCKGKNWRPSFLDKKGSQLTITSKFNIQLSLSLLLLFLMVIGSAEKNKDHHQ